MTKIHEGPFHDILKNLFLKITITLQITLFVIHYYAQQLI